LSDPFEILSLQEIEEMEKQRSQAIKSLGIPGNSVKCQKCSVDIPIVGKMPRPHNDRVAILQKKIKWIENLCRSNINRPSYINEVKQLKQELAELSEDAKYIS
jgi:hypothetical protein